MARVNYTYTAIYNKSPIKTERYPAESSYGRTYALEPQLDEWEAPPKSRSNDTPMLALLFFVIPILGLLAIMFKPMRWVFAGASVLSFMLMWAIHAFLPRARALVSMLLVALCAFSIYAAVAQPTLQNGSDTLAAGGSTLSPFVSNSTTVTTTNPLMNSAFQTAPPPPTVDVDQLLVSDYAADNRVLSDAERVLDSYMAYWQAGPDYTNMIELTWPEWRASNTNVNTAMFFIHSTRKLMSWTITPPTIGDKDTSAMVSVTATIQQSTGTEVQTAYTVLMHTDGTTWYVDPSSFRAGINIAQPTPAPDPNATPTPKPASSVKSSTTLYYNTAKGKFYHTKSDCPTIGPEYVKKMSSFKYDQLNDTAYKNLKQCTTCNAPPRP
ncbi:hypothetical protein FACS18948_1570 [Clostridia bacterium]|nr:hypothetical protein FACS18948_1570 [Clostridia bacterium]